MKKNQMALFLHHILAVQTNKFKKTVTFGWTSLIIIISMLFCGCASLYEMDLAEQRRINITEDLYLLGHGKPADFPDPLTLDDAVRIGLQNNLDIRIFRIMTEIENDNALAEKLKMLPQLNLQGKLSHRSEYDLKEYENLDTGNKTLGRSVSEEKLRKSFDISLSWNILDFGLSYIRARQAAIKKEIKRMERLRQTQNLTLEIAVAYWKAVLAEHELEYIRKIETQVQQYKEKAEIMAAQKRIDPIGVKTIEKRIADMAITASNLEADISGARIGLCRLMGLSPMTDFNLVGKSFQNYLEKMPKPGELDPEKLEMVSLHNRPEFYSADMELQVQQDEARAALMSMFPGIRFDISNYYDDNKYMVNNYWASIGVNVVANVLSLPSKYMKLKAEDRKEAMTKARRLLLTATVIAQAHLALHDYMVKEKQFRLHDESYSISEELMSMNRERYELGAVSDTAITQQMMENMVTRLERNRSLIDMITAYNVLLVTLGLDYSQWDESLTDMDEKVLPDDIEIRDIWNEENKDAECPGSVPTQSGGMGFNFERHQTCGVSEVSF
ncbi:MAG: TolC family protein [Desulfobacteraceae bacterium]|nr:TolC family protein [Desulfobacteraceae bacterium]